MRKFLIIFLITLYSGVLKAQSPHIAEIDYENFSIFYNDTTANAFVGYKLYKSLLLSPVKVAREAKFHATGNRPNLTEIYKHSGYDIGHYYSAKNARYDTIAEMHSFDFANTRPQRHLLNAYRYFALENYERAEAIAQDSLVVVAWDTGSIGKLGGKVNIPEYCWKKLIYRDSTVMFKMPNNDTVMRHPWYWYKIK